MSLFPEVAANNEIRERFFQLVDNNLDSALGEQNLSFWNSLFKSKYIVFEGLDGSGKSTLQQFLVEELFSQKKSSLFNLEHLAVREPGSTPFGEQMRKLLLEQDYNLQGFSELMLFMASRNELIHQQILPALADGKTVLSDRCYISSYAYQAKPNGISIELFDNIVKEIYKKHQIDIIVYLDVMSHEVGLKRATKDRQADNIESKGVDYFLQTQAGYEEILQRIIKDMHQLNLEDYQEKLSNLWSNGLAFSLASDASSMFLMVKEIGMKVLGLVNDQFATEFKTKWTAPSFIPDAVDTNKGGNNTNYTNDTKDAKNTKTTKNPEKSAQPSSLSSLLGGMEEYSTAEFFDRFVKVFTNKETKQSVIILNASVDSPKLVTESFFIGLLQLYMSGNF